MIVDGTASTPAEKRLVTFGRFKGKPLGALSSGYLRWLSLQQGHCTLWPRLAKQVLRQRNAFQGKSDQDLENPDRPICTDLSSPHAAPWKQFLNGSDTLRTCARPATFVSLLQWCGSSQSLGSGQNAHHHILLRGLEHHLLLRNLIVQMYGDCGALEDALAHLVAMCPPADASAWNLMMKAYMQHGYAKEVLELFDLMLVRQIEPNRATILSILGMCGKLVLLHEGRLTHHFTVDAGFMVDVIVGNTFIAMYGKCGSPDDACQVFEQLPKSDIVTWNALIASSCRNGMGQMSMYLHMQMKQEGCLPDEITCVSILDACASTLALLEGHRIHVHVLAMHLESSVIVGTALVNMYGKCGLPEDARQSFDEILQRNTVCWTAMISAYAWNKCSKDAVELFALMEKEGVHPNRVTFISLLDACATSANLSLGGKLFDRIRNSHFMMDVKVGTALLNMYGRCGRVEDARNIFNNLLDRDVAAWNAMIAVYAHHGQSEHALELLEQMKRNKTRPNMRTYTSILSMCSRVGLIHQAFELFKLREDDYGITLVEHHQNCIIDLLAKAGRLDEAEHLVQDLPAAQPSYIPAMTLLGACSNQIDVKRGQHMAQLLFRLGRSNKDPYTMMLGIRAANSVHRVARFASRLHEKPPKDLQGKCMIRLGGQMHEFLPDDRSHPLIDDLFSELTRLTTKMQRAGYFSCIVERDLEAFDHRQHPEMLACAFGLIGTSPSTPLYITKDRSLCPICHLVIKYMSKVSSHEIVIKDSFCLHEFKHGLCSCAS